MPTLPSWGYNGCARRYWDFQYAGKIRRIERQLHHYGSGLNAIPVLTAYRDHPEDLYLLRVGYGGLMGAITSIDQEGFASAAFHSFPDTLRWDPISGDYAQNFTGYALNAATYLVKDPAFGWQAFGGNTAVAVARLRVEQPARPGAATHAVRQPMKTEREAYLIPLGTTTAWIDLVTKQ